MTTLKKIALLAVVVAALVLAALGGGWKWGDGHGSHLAGWAWGDEGGSIVLDTPAPATTTPALSAPAAPQAEAALENNG